MTESEWIERIRERVHRLGDDPLLQSGEIFSFVEEALTQYPLSARLWNMRGDLIQVSDGESYSLQDALASYQRAVELKPDDPEAYESIGYYCDAVDGRIADAEPAFRRAVELGGRASSWAGLARVLAELGRKDEALVLIGASSCPYANEPEVLDVYEEIRAGMWDPSAG